MSENTSNVTQADYAFLCDIQEKIGEVVEDEEKAIEAGHRVAGLISDRGLWPTGEGNSPASGAAESYTAAQGDVWKKDGPIGAHEVIRAQFPGREHYDGGLKGVECRVTRTKGSDAPKEVFVPAKDDEHFAQKMRDNGRHLAAV